MIRKFETKDTERVLQIWLEANMETHDFVPGDYWLSQYQSVQEQLLQADIYVYERDEEIQGFVGMMDEYLAGIFVDKKYRSMGVGKGLLECIKKKYFAFSLNVYQKNRRAVDFYLREGLTVASEGIDEDTAEADYTMAWSRKEDACMIAVRDATIADAERILEIYDYYVKNTAITFEYDTPSVEEFKERMKQTMSRYPYLIIAKDNIIQGYAYAGSFIGRAAYDWSCEMTIYLDPNARKSGMGRRLYEALETKLKEMGILNLYACIGCPEADDKYLTTNSADFHAHMGFVKVGEFHKCGYKFDHWYNMIWMEKMIGRHSGGQASIVYYPELK